MKRDLSQLRSKNYDLIVIGGGIYGACLTWEATLRGLSVALLEKADFGGGASANSLKIIHGGLRYLQNADFKRMRESIHERTTLMGIAPHLVHPLPVMLPTYGYGLKSKEALSVALWLNDLIGADRNHQLDHSKHIPPGKTISKQACLAQLPSISEQGLTGAAIFSDAQVYNSERLTLAFIRSAVEQGATVANYVEVKELLKTENQVVGVKAIDVLTNNQLEVRATTVINATGAWINQIQDIQQNLAKGMNFVLRRPLFSKYAVGIRDSQNKRLLFVAPWRGTSIVGTYYSVCGRDPQTWQITPTEIDEFLQQINQAYPPAKLTKKDIAYIHQGRLPRTGINAQGEPILAKHYQIKDHSQEGLTGLFSVIGVKYTTARDVAQKVMDTVFKSWGKNSPPSVSATTPLFGGDIQDFQTFLTQAQKSSYLPQEIITSLVYNYGSAYSDVLSDLDVHQQPEKAVLQAEIIYAIEQEMAQKLSDIIFRRTEIGSAGYPQPKILQFCAEVMGKKLNWSKEQLNNEINNC